LGALSHCSGSALLKTWNLLVTGSSGLIGSEAVEYFDRLGHAVTGIDNNMRHAFFGPSGDTEWNLRRLMNATQRFTHTDIDLRDHEKIVELFARQKFDAVLHCAAQPSHDKARDIPLLDFEVNAAATVYLLEATRKYCPEAVFIFASTNKVYGDAPNEKPLRELPTRYDYADPSDFDGIDESCRIDQAMHSLFGASKTAADIYAQEYGKYFGLKVGIFRCGCLTGPNQSGVELHGFLSHLVRVALRGETYKIYGYKGKQVRDNLHSGDAVRAFEEFVRAPRSGEVYNLGGGRENSVSLLEAIALVEEMVGRKVQQKYCEQPRRGDHICYISDLTKLKSHYPNWRVTRDLPSILEEMVTAEKRERQGAGAC
jgi:CDP-paratose 2-epimerase